MTQAVYNLCLDIAVGYDGDEVVFGSETTLTTGTPNVDFVLLANIVREIAAQLEEKGATGEFDRLEITGAAGEA